MKEKLLAIVMSVFAGWGIGDCLFRAYNYFSGDKTPLNKPVYQGWCDTHAPQNILDGDCLDCQVWISRDKIIFEMLIREGLIKGRTVE